ncbi:MAG TPA: response regulator [Verrucomicrobiae bacterium]|nr:response regulator [Verrucomicrobiae bacterium]
MTDTLGTREETPKNRRILVIDDNRAIHNDFRKVLTASTPAASDVSSAEAVLFDEKPAAEARPNFTVDSAFQGKEGLELVQQAVKNQQPFAMAFVDIRMPPGWDGVETTQKLWEVDPELQVVICTAYSDYSWDELMSKVGNSDRLLILKKPFDTVEVLQIANALTQKWWLRQELKRQMDALEKTVQERTQRLHQALEDLKSAQEQVIQQERLRALGGMASGIAHDFNNSLVGILGLTELLLQRPENLDDKPKAKRYLEMINTTAKDAGKIVNRLREFYRFREQREATEPVDLNRLVEGAISLTQPRWKTQAETRNVSIVMEKDLHDIPTIDGNVSELREVLTNLIFNAVDAMPKGGKIAVRTRLDGSRVVLEVSDTGHGMTEEIRRRCFEPFFTTKGVHGSGLGLSMVHGILQRHQATVEIETEINKGTTFVIRFPQTSRQPQTASAAKPAGPIHNLHVLVVDDEPMVREVITEYLAADGHQVLTADGGRDGVAKFKKDEFDLVLVDRAMPDMNGDQVASAIKSVDSNTPIVMLTGFGSMMEATSEKPAFVDLVIGKPVTMVDLRAALANAVGAQPAAEPAPSIA